MNTQAFNRAKYSLLKEIDIRFQRYYRERLSDVINDLRLHYTDIRPDPSADDLIAVISRNKILHFASAGPMRELRETFDRLREGTYGLCSECGESIAADLLEQRPTATVCARCSKKHGTRSGS